MALNTIKPKVTTINLNKTASPAVQRIRGHKLAKIRDRILLRDECTCQMCGRVSSDLEVDHKIPLHLGGTESDDNRWCLCRECHQYKTAAEEKGRGV